MTDQRDMNYDEMVDWIAALRSGQYKQTSHHLCKYIDVGEHFYCCLGVAWFRREPNSPDFTGTITACEAMGLYKQTIPDAIYKEDMPSILAQRSLSNRTLGHALVYMNDSLRWSFQEIADWLEKRVLPLMPQC